MNANHQNAEIGTKLESAEMPALVNKPANSNKVKTAARKQKETVSLTTQFDKEIYSKLFAEKKALGFQHEQDIIRLAVGIYFERKK